MLYILKKSDKKSDSILLSIKQNLAPQVYQNLARSSSFLSPASCIITLDKYDLLFTKLDWHKLMLMGPTQIFLFIMIQNLIKF